MQDDSEIFDQHQPIQKLLYVHQQQWQQPLMGKYRNEILLLDATYKTTNYALPFFFVRVKTTLNMQFLVCLALLDVVLIKCHAGEMTSYKYKKNRDQ